MSKHSDVSGNQVFGEKRKDKYKNERGKVKSQVCYI